MKIENKSECPIVQLSEIKPGDIFRDKNDLSLYIKGNERIRRETCTCIRLDNGHVAYIDADYYVILVENAKLVIE